MSESKQCPLCHRVLTTPAEVEHHAMGKHGLAKDALQLEAVEATVVRPVELQPRQRRRGRKR